MKSDLPLVAHRFHSNRGQCARGQLVMRVTIVLPVVCGIGRKKKRKEIMEGETNYVLTRDKAIEIFSLLVGMEYDVAIKYAKGKFYVEVPVTLAGSKSYGKQPEIMALAQRGGLTAIQTGQTLRIVGR